MLGNMKELYLQELRSNGLGIELTDESPASEIEDAYYSMKKFTDIDKIYAIISTYKDEDDETHTEYKFSLDKDKLGKKLDVDKMKEICDEAAKILQIPVYGGDCIVSADGSFKIIDFNDWPSFSACREEAAAAICNLI